MPAEPMHYVPLLLLFPLGLAAAPASHIAFLGFLIALRPTTTANYCNCVASIVLGVLLLIDNNRIVCGWVYRYFSRIRRHMSYRWW